MIKRGDDMTFYEIILHKPPEIWFACEVVSKNYYNKFVGNKNSLEIGVMLEGDTYLDREKGGLEMYVKDTLLCIAKDLRGISYTRPNTLKRHITVGVITDYDLKQINTETEDLSKYIPPKHAMLIPTAFYLGDDKNKIVSSIEKIIQLYVSSSNEGRLKAIAAWYELTAELTHVVLKNLDGSHLPFEFSHNKYLDEAKNYISEHYREKIAVADIAYKLGISEGYLYHLFKRGTNMSVMEYCNSYRVNMAKQYIKNGAFSLKEISVLVGIDDPAYMSRLFKKITGVSYREYRENSQRIMRK